MIFDNLKQPSAPITLEAAEHARRALEAAVPLLIKLGDFIGNAEGRCETLLLVRDAIPRLRPTPDPEVTRACTVPETCAHAAPPAAVDAGRPAPYWTIRIPYVSSAFQTEWHPTSDSGPFAVLNRGAFKSEGDAIAWARRHLGGTPYSLKYIDTTDPEVI